MSAYCTIAEADVYLALNYDWAAYSSDEKQSYLDWGRIYIDSVYTCLDDDGESYDDTTAPDELKHANAIAAVAQSEGSLFSDEKAVIEESVKAGSVESSKRYAMAEVSTVDVPEKAQIKALLQSLCTRSASGNMVSLTRN